MNQLRNEIGIRHTFKTNSKIAEVSPFLSVITLKISRLNSPRKRQTVTKEMRHDAAVHFPQETHFRSKDTDRLK